DARQRPLAASVARDVESPLASHVHFNLVSLLELQRLHDGGRETDGKTVAPFCDPHCALLEIHYALCISTASDRQLADDGTTHKTVSGRAPSGGLTLGSDLFAAGLTVYELLGCSGT